MCKDQLPIAPQYIKDFEQLGLGMFVHFGIYSQLAKGEWSRDLCDISPEDYEALETIVTGISYYNAKNYFNF